MPLTAPQISPKTNRALEREQDQRDLLAKRRGEVTIRRPPKKLQRFEVEVSTYALNDEKARDVNLTIKAIDSVSAILQAVDYMKDKLRRREMIGRISVGEPK